VALPGKISHITRTLRWSYVLGKWEFHYIHVKGIVILVKHYDMTAYGSGAEV
jgi:hypothetical protein